MGRARPYTACRIGLTKFWMAPKAAAVNRKNKKHSHTGRERKKSSVDARASVARLAPWRGSAIAACRQASASKPDKATNTAPKAACRQP